ncbi:Nucleotidyltransferase family protein [Crenothrix polyspora]|uniref:Nucleotidyltransferase family protein n=1 Tax=Crenothrix polyspora TaxID=360316 RepID=A0A1R4GYB4_9GAMM|nr:nucleotidyltransferase domain-containing protein [Crenothrix polyspora]SJM88955.1 Nucleotidyltransferase family protein [Crenothrix polyspora]
MRLSEIEHQLIRQAIIDIDPEADIYLFGSRTNDHAKGGDIDVLVISKKISLIDKLTILAKLHLRLGEQKIDLVVFPDLTRPFARIAQQGGIAL